MLNLGLLLSRSMNGPVIGHIKVLQKNSNAMSPYSM